MPKGLDYIINLKDGDFGGAGKAKAEVRGLDEAVEGAESKFGGLGGMIGKVGGLLAAAFAVEKVIDFGKESYDMYKSTALATAQIQQGIKTTGDISGRSLQELIGQADELEKKSLFTQAQIEQAQSIELTFTNIRGAVFDRAIPAIEDLATRMGGDGPADLKGASVQLGKALNDPITGLTALRRVGVSFSDEQKKLITDAVKHGDVVKAQGIILKELNTEFGGSASAAKNALGPMGDLDKQTEELKKSTGALINDGLKVIVPALTDFIGVIQEGIKWVKENKDLIVDTAIVVGTAGAAYLLYEGVILALEAPMAIMTAAQWALNVAMDANPVGIIVVGIGALIGGLIAAYHHSDKFRAILAGIGEVAHELIPVFKGLGEIILGAMILNPKLVIDGFKDAYGGIKDIIASGGIGGAFNKGYDESMASSKKDEAAEAAKTKAQQDALRVHKPGADKPYTISTGKRGGGGSDSTTLSSGKSVRNVVVTIGKLVEKLEVHTTNIQGMGAQDIKRQITELIVGAVHEGELALGSQ